MVLKLSKLEKYKDLLQVKLIKEPLDIINILIKMETKKKKRYNLFELLTSHPNNGVGMRVRKKNWMMDCFYEIERVELKSVRKLNNKIGWKTWNSFCDLFLEWSTKNTNSNKVKWCS
jgi:hypothetical protein